MSRKPWYLIAALAALSAAGFRWLAVERGIRLVAGDE